MSNYLQQIVVDRNIIGNGGLDCYLDSRNIELLITDTFLIEMVKNAKDWPITALKDLTCLEPHLDNIRLSISVGEALRKGRHQKRTLTTDDLLDKDLEPIVIEIKRAARPGSNYLPTFIENVTKILPALREEGSLRKSANFDLVEFTEKLKSTFGKEMVSDLRGKRLSFNSKLSHVLMSALLAYRAYLEDDSHAVSPPLDSMFFRHFVLKFWRSIRWIEQGGLESRTEANMSNDEYDDDYVLIGSYFNKTLSKENSVTEADAVLRSIMDLVRSIY